MSKIEKKAQKMETTFELVKRLKLKIYDLSLVTRALTHRSFINEHPEEMEDNERLGISGGCRS